MFSKKNKDPLVESAKKVMNENNIRRQVERQINEEIGIESRKQLPNELLADYDHILAEAVKKALDPVGQEDPDIDNDGDKDETDSYLENRRKAIQTAMQKKKKVNEQTFPNGLAGNANRLQDIRASVANSPASWQGPDISDVLSNPQVAKTLDVASTFLPPVSAATSLMYARRGEGDKAAEYAMGALPGLKAISSASRFIDNMGTRARELNNPNRLTGGQSPTDIAAQDVAYDAVRKNLFPGDYDQKKIDGQNVYVNEPRLDTNYDDILTTAVRRRLGISPVEKGQGPWGPQAARPKDLRGKFMEEQTEAQKEKVAKVMDEFKKGELHSGKGKKGKKGKIVRKPSQAIAIALKQAGLSKQQNEEVTFDNLNEEIAVNLLSKIQYVFENFGNEGFDEYMNNLSEESKSILESYITETKFGVAFQDARRRGQEVFVFDGKKYKSIMKGETEAEWKAKMAKNAAPPVPLERRADRPAPETLDLSALKTIPVKQTDLPPLSPPVAKATVPVERSAASPFNQGIPTGIEPLADPLKSAVDVVLQDTRRAVRASSAPADQAVQMREGTFK